MWRFVGAVVGLGIVVVLGFSLIDPPGGGDVQASALLTITDRDNSGFERAVAPRDWDFPADHGPHPQFQTEWWYYTGNLSDPAGRRFGFQFTIFRRAISPSSYESDSEWRADQIYLGHLSLTDVADDAYYHDQRLSRGSAGLAGATIDPRYRVWLESWQVIGQDENATRTAITATSGAFALDLHLEQIKPPALQGDRGLSAKSGDPGNASHYYSLSRLLTDGSVTVGGQTYSVSGTTWMDHEFSTSALGNDALGWDWFGLHLDDERDLMLGQIRRVDGGKEPAFGGLLVMPDGDTQLLTASDITIEALDSWTSPHSGATYPAGWQIRVDNGDEPLDLTIRPLVADQELYDAGIVYWEGAVSIDGDTTGYGYAELTGYADSMTGRF